MVDPSAASFKISIHAPREGSDVIGDLELELFGISIHAPREGSDVQNPRSFAGREHFYPRSP